MMENRHDLQRFVEAQGASRFGGAGVTVYESALAELKAGRKTGHWIWFIFPQLKGLGQSCESEFYGLNGAAEAVSYLAHPVLGPRLRACVAATLAHRTSAEDIFAGIDALKFRSSLTLFARAAPGEAIFRQALDRFFSGEEDARTLEILGAKP